MSPEEYITARIQAAPVPLQWIHDPAGITSTLEDGSTLSVDGKSYRVLRVDPDGLLRFRHAYEQARATGSPLAVVSGSQPAAVADIAAVCQASRRGHSVDCSPSAILAAAPPLGTGKAWHSLIDGLGNEFASLIESLVALTAEHPTAHPNLRPDALRLVVAAQLAGTVDPASVRRMLTRDLAPADLYALALAWEQSDPGPALRGLWRELRDEWAALAPGRAGAVSDDGSWLTLLEELQRRNELRNFLLTTLALHRYGANVPALRPGIIGLATDQSWTRRLGLTPDAILGFLQELRERHISLYRSLLTEYDRWLRTNRAVLEQLLVALELGPSSPSLERARQVVEQEEEFPTLLVAGLRALGNALCRDPDQASRISAGILRRVRSTRPREAAAPARVFDLVYQMTDRLSRLKVKAFLERPELESTPDLWLREIYPHYLAGLDLLAARLKVANDTTRLVDQEEANGLRARCAEVLNEFNQAFFRMVEAQYPEWVRQPTTRPTLTCDLLERVFLREFRSFVRSDRQSIYLIIFDGMRYDLWKEVRPLVERCFEGRLALRSEECALSLLPTATQYTRKAIFAGAFPADWKRRGNGVDPETSEIRLLKEALQRRSVQYADRLPDNLLTGGESEMREEDLRALIEDAHQVIKPLIFNFADDQSHHDDSDLQTLYDKLLAEFRNRIRPLLSQIGPDSLVIITSDHGFYDTWNSRKQTVPGLYGAIRWRYAALRRREAQLGVPEDVVVMPSRDIRLNVEYTYRLESTREFDGSDEGTGPGGGPFAYPAYVFCRPRAILGRKRVPDGVYIEELLGEVEQFAGNTKQRYEHGGISLQEMVIPVAVFGPGKKTGRPDLRVEAVERRYVAGASAALTLKLSNFGSAPADQVRVSVQGIQETGAVERVLPGSEAADMLDFGFTPSADARELQVTVVYVHEGQQVILTQSIYLTVEDDPTRVVRKRLF